MIYRLHKTPCYKMFIEDLQSKTHQVLEAALQKIKKIAIKMLNKLILLSIDSKQGKFIHNINSINYGSNESIV